MSESPRLHYPATARNRDPILEVLRGVLPDAGLVVEIASGSGEHVTWLAARFPGLTWQPTDIDPRCLDSIDAWRAELATPNVLPARFLDVHERPWPIERARAVWCANLIHIAPWSACLALLDGAAATLDAGAPLVLYGPYRRHGDHTAPSNAAFDASLRSRDPRWGVRDLEAVLAAAAAVGLRHDQTIAMPANNLSVVLRKA